MEIQAEEIDFGSTAKTMGCPTSNGTSMKIYVKIVSKNTMIMSCINLFARDTESRPTIMEITKEKIGSGFTKILNLYKRKNGTSYKILVIIMRLFTNILIRRNTNVSDIAQSINTIMENIIMDFVLKSLVEIKS